MKFKKNIVAEIHLDYFQQPPTRNCKIIGTNGTIFWDSKTNQVKVYDIKKKKWIRKLKVKKNDKNSTYKNEILHFIDCVKNRKKTINPIEEGTKTLKVALAILKSAKTKKVEKL